MVPLGCEATSQNRLGLAYIVSCLVQEIQNLNETLEFYKVNLVYGNVPETGNPTDGFGPLVRFRTPSRL